MNYHQAPAQQMKLKAIVATWNVRTMLEKKES